MAIARIGVKTPNTPVATPNVVRLNRPASTPVHCRSDTVIEIARKHATDHRFVFAGADLFAEGETSDYLYVVLDGWLLLHRILEDGRRQILDFGLPGAVIGFRAQPETTLSFTAEAITDAQVAVIPISRIDQLLRCGSDCAITLLDAANVALLDAFDTITDIGRRTAREAIAHFLLRMDRRIRRTARKADQDPVPFPLTQEHIGDALGLTAVHVCRTLRALRNDGLVEAGRGRLSIRDRKALSNEAGASTVEPNEARLAS